MYTTADAVPPGLLGRARQRGCELALYAQGDAQWDPAAERQFLRQARDQRQRGLLAFCTPKPPHNDALLRDLERCGVRVLHIEHYRIEPPEQPYLLPDFRRAGHMAAVALLIAGYRYLYIVGYPGAPSPFEQLLELGFADALREHRPDLDPASCQREFPQFEDGVDTDATYQAKLVRLMRELPAASGLVVHVADHADRLLAAARQAGIAVPERCGLIGIDVAGPGKPARAGTVDSLVFDRPALLQRALDCVLANDWHPPRELVMPVHVRRNTIRARH
jgi:DNA-binding LacI/PurR family transcriptional regulator